MNNKQTAFNAIEEAAKSVLGGYNSWIDTFMCFFDIVQLTPWGYLKKLTEKLCSANILAKMKYTANNNIDIAEAKTMLNFAALAYSNIGVEYKKYLNNTEKYGVFTSEELKGFPESIRTLYKEQSGKFDLSKDLPVLLKINRETNTVVVGFSGTNLSNFDMVKADLMQLSTHSILYYRAAGILNLLLKNFPTSNFIITGHSLGGGLVQFAATANSDLIKDRKGTFKGYCFNPAGLSLPSLKALGDKSLSRAKDYLYIIMTKFDPVSCIGAKIGTCMTLPQNSYFYKQFHSIDDLYNNMQQM